jgi:hypothetical protein
MAFVPISFVLELFLPVLAIVLLEGGFQRRLIAIYCNFFCIYLVNQPQLYVSEFTSSISTTLFFYPAFLISGLTPLYIALTANTIYLSYKKGKGQADTN